MRRNLVTGGVLAVAAALIVVVSQGLGLDLESAALLGGATGAVVALVPDRTAGSRLGGFAAGFVVAWLGYVARAAVLPDTAGGRAVAVFVVVALCTLIALSSRDRLPLWSVLLGAGTFAGAYEFTFAAAPPELLSTSLTTATTLLFNVAIGFLAGSIIGPSRATGTQASAHRAGTPAPSNDASYQAGYQAGTDAGTDIFTGAHR